MHTYNNTSKNVLGTFIQKNVFYKKKAQDQTAFYVFTLI